jgi:hypothetical protein
MYVFRSLFQTSGVYYGVRDEGLNRLFQPGALYEKKKTHKQY